MRAVLMMAELSRRMSMLIDKMADVGDFTVPHDFFERYGGVEVQPAALEDTVAKALSQGTNAAAHDCVAIEHNPYEAGTDEANAWHQGFTEARQATAKPKRRTRSAKAKESES
jgi:hypothetical protein